MQTATRTRRPLLAPILMIFIGLVTFALIAADVVHQGKLQQLDRPIQAAIHNFAQSDHTGSLPWGAIFFSAISGLGHFPVIVFIGILVGGWLSVRRRWRPLLVWAIALVGSGIINSALKNYFQIPRPSENTFYSPTPGYSFPSGHTMAVAITFGALAIILVSQFPLTPRKKAALLAATTLLCLLIAFALMYIGVHYLTDVTAALAISLAWLGVIALLLPKREVAKP